MHRTNFLVILSQIILAVVGPSALVRGQIQAGYPTAASKKGLQVALVDDAIELGVKHATFNVNLCSLIDLHKKPSSFVWRTNEIDYCFHRAPIERLDRKIKALSDRGVLVYLILLTYLSDDPTINRIMIHPDCDPNAPNRLGSFNTVTSDGKSWLRATIEFLSWRWSRKDLQFGRVVGYIVGNEVNSHWWWNNMGPVSMPTFADQYLHMVRLTHESVTKHCPWARVYISLEHHWNIRYPAGNETQAFPGRDFLEYFAMKARQSGDFAWHIAFHPYPENLFEPRFWNDRSAVDHETSPRITFKNLQVLAKFVNRQELLYGGEPRRIILSEQGFHTPKGVDGEAVQAAAYCYAYKIVEDIEEIDAFILHRHIDHRGEGGLLLGLRSYKPSGDERYAKKKIYECFRLADTADWSNAFEFALPIVGLENWRQLKRVYPNANLQP